MLQSRANCSSPLTIANPRRICAPLSEASESVRRFPGLALRTNRTPPSGVIPVHELVLQIVERMRFPSGEMRAPGTRPFTESSRCGSEPSPRAIKMSAPRVTISRVPSGDQAASLPAISPRGRGDPMGRGRFQNAEAVPVCGRAAISRLP